MLDWALDIPESVSKSYADITPGDLVWIMVPGVGSGKLGLTIMRYPRGNGRSNYWSVLVSGEVSHYVDYLLSPIDQ